MKAIATKCRPILMSVPMVQGCLRDENPKTQTRRLVKPQPHESVAHFRTANEAFFQPIDASGSELKGGMTCPYGVPGDVLWVRETWGCPSADHPKAKGGRKPQQGDKIVYAANDADAYQWRGGPGCADFCWRPSIHMPRWACRLYLEVVSVRVERVQDISEADAIAEGIQRVAKVGDHPGEWFWGTEPIPEKYSSDDLGRLIHKRTPIEAYATLWDSINGAGSWAANPWCWVIAFKRTENPQ